MKYLLLLLFAIPSLSMGQKVNVSPDAKVNALNNYVYFTNESVHGLLIIQRMLESFNKDVNKYVDLESIKVNFYGNKDLPANIFVDEDNWFYDTSPYEWFIKAKQDNKILDAGDATSLDLHMSSMKYILGEVNAKRFEIEKYIASNDLSQEEAQQGVYALLERCVTLYEQFWQSQQSLEAALSIAYSKYRSDTSSLPLPTFRQAIGEAYTTTRDIMVAIRNKQDENFEQYITAQGKASEKIQSMSFADLESSSKASTKLLRYRDNMLLQLSKSLKGVNRFYSTADVEPAYRLYGKFYYYYNSDLINKFNRYGNGIVFEMNRMLDLLEMPILRYTELPHYFKVIYPKKVVQDVIVATDDNIQKLPEQLRKRKITTAQGNVIRVDSDLVEFDLYDHFIEDGDIVDINYNGDWIIDSLTLVTKPKRVKLKLNDEGRNYILLHARNVGSRPPNTMAVKYTFRGREKQIIMSSDLNKSELIEIVRVD